MYGIAGERRLTEWEVPWLPGYEGAPPVRIGNAAHGQLQLDVYGEVMDALHQARRGGLAASEAGWALQRALLDHLESDLDASPTKASGRCAAPRRHFTYSKVMAWVAFDRGDQERRGIRASTGPLDRWRELRDADPRRGLPARLRRASCGSFVQSYGCKQLDASLLLLPAVGFLPPDDPRMRGTVEAIERRLLVDGFVLRYDTDDIARRPAAGRRARSSPAASGWSTPTSCSAAATDARALFERLLALRNDVGLLSEEYDPRAGRLVGNFPQAFSHVALVNSAFNLTRRKAGAAAVAAGTGGTAPPVTAGA